MDTPPNSQSNQIRKFSNNHKTDLHLAGSTGNETPQTYTPQKPAEQLSVEPTYGPVISHPVGYSHQNRGEASTSVNLSDQKAAETVNTNIVQNSDKTPQEKENTSPGSANLKTQNHDNISQETQVNNSGAEDYHSQPVKLQAEAIDRTKEAIDMRRSGIGPGKRYMIFATVATILLLIVGVVGMIFFVRSYNNQSGQWSQNLR